MEEKQKCEADQANPTDKPGSSEFEEGALPPPEQEAPPQEPPASALQVRFAGPGLAHIVSMQTKGEVTLGQLSYLGMFLVAQAFHEWGMPLFHEMVKGTMMQVLTELLKPKIETARAGFRIPPDVLKPN